MKVIGNLTKDAIIRAAVSEGISASESVGSEVVFESAICSHIAPVYDSNEDKTVIFYTDNGSAGYGTAIVSTLSGTSLSYGTPVVFNNVQTNYISAAFDSNSNKIVVVYQDDTSGPGKAIVGTVSGTSISFGSEVTFNASVTSRSTIVFDSNSNKVVIGYRDNGNSNYGTAIVGTVSGTSISFGSPTVFESATVEYLALTFDSNSNKVVIGYGDNGNSGYGTAIVGTVSGTSISFGSAAVFESANIYYTEAAFDSDTNKVVICYIDEGNSYHGTAVVGTVSGTSISFGTPVVFQTSQANTYGIIYNTATQKITIFFRDASDSNKGTVISGAVSGTSITFDTKVVVAPGVTEGYEANSAAFDSANNVMIMGYRDDGGTAFGTAVAYRAAFSQATGGTIADGKPVIVNANGTVSSVGETAISQVIGSPTIFEAATTEYISSTFDSTNNKVVVFYKDDANSSYGTAVVGTVSGTSISFGTPVVFHNDQTRFISSAFDSNEGKLVIVYRDDNNDGDPAAIVGTVSGTSISFGTPVFVSTDQAKAETMGCTFDSSQNKIVISWSAAYNSNYGTAIVGTVSGTSISFGTPTVFYSNTARYLSSTFDSSNNKTVVAFRGNTSGYGEAVVGTVSGTSISFGSSVVFSTQTSGGTADIATAFDSNSNKVVIGWQDGTDSNKGAAVVGTVSGTSISFGSKSFFADSATGSIAAVFDTNIKKIVFAYRDNSNNFYGTVTSGSVSGSSITFGSETVFETARANYNSICFDTNLSKAVIAFSDNGNSNQGTSLVFQAAGSVPNITSENFVGFMDGAALDGTNGEILSSCSIARNQTSLTPGQTYFVTPAGALSTTAGSPSVTAGTAISSTELIVKG